MTFPDIRHYNNLGPLAIRDENFAARNQTLDTRLCLVMAAIQGADDEAQRVIVNNTLGDVLGFTRFDNREGSPPVPSGPVGSESTVPTEKSRPMPAWFAAVPVIGMGDGLVLPIRDLDYTPDERFISKDVRAIKGKKLKQGRTGIVIAATEEGGPPQDLLLGLGDSDLIAVNRTPEQFEQGTLVYDIDENGELSEQFFARLQTAWNVFLPKSGGWIDEKYDGLDKGYLAWQLGNNGQGQPCNGLSVDHTNSSDSGATGTTRMFAQFGKHGGGPLWVGEEKDEEHILDYSIGDEPVASGHIHHLALFKMPIFAQKAFKRGDYFDGPLEFREEIYTLPPKLPFETRTHLQFDPELEYSWVNGGLRGVWRWLTEDAIGGSKVPPPQDPPGDPTEPPPLPPQDPVPPHDDGGKHKSVKVLPSSFSQTVYGPHEEYRQTPLTHAFASQILKSGYNQINSTNMRDYTRLPSDKELWDWVATAPIVGREECYGGYTGLINPVYTNRPQSLNSPYYSGTGPGGKVLFQPEINIADLRLYCETGTDPALYTAELVSELNSVIAPLGYLAFGYPDLETGGFKKGWRVKSTLGSKLEWSIKTYAGVESTLLTFPDDTTDPFEFANDVQTDDDLIFKSGTAYKASIRHNHTTSDKTHHIPNLSGMFGMFDSSTFDHHFAVTSASAARQFSFPDESGTLKLKKDKVAFFGSGEATGIGGHAAGTANVGAGKTYIEFHLPDDYVSLTSLEVVLFSSATDASVDIDFVTTYGAGGEARNTHSGSSTGTTYNLTKDRITEISITSLVSSGAAQDYVGIEIENNDAATIIYVMCVKIVYVSTN